MKKKFVAIMLALLLLAGVAAGCTSAELYDPVYQPPAVDYPAEPPYDAEDPDDFYSGSSSLSFDDLFHDGKYDDRWDVSAGEGYLSIEENGWVSTDRESMATISMKVDTAAYDNVARYIESGIFPPKNAVRTEELINYFSYEEELTPEYGTPFALYTEVAPSPTDPSKHYAFVRIKTKDIDRALLPPSNIVFLIDTSGSMSSHDKLPLLQDALALFVETLGERDRISIVTYAGNSDVKLQGVSGAEKNKIQREIARLSAGGSTAGGKGIQTAYEVAAEHFIPGGNNRIILATDGDFNVGISSINDLKNFISEKRETGVYLSVLGFGTGNLQDSTCETLAANGNGNYSYIRSLEGARKVLVEEMAANLFTVADDVKAQIEFNPAWVRAYRLVGYENRQLDNSQFRDDKVDAGEVGVGTDIVALFELDLYGAAAGDLYKYKDEEVAPAPPPSGEFANEILEVRIRYKDPGEDKAQEITRAVTTEQLRTAAQSSADFRFACAVAAFGDLLRGSKLAGNTSFREVLRIAEDSLGRDAKGYRKAFLALLQLCINMD
ncbi:MAG: VWA domain-containing protein [Clostridiales bacterium]|nr:VWA domain-containing protein [Clostridiales bacterium]